MEREGRKECSLCDAECESVSHVLWDCPAYTVVFYVGVEKGAWR